MSSSHRRSKKPKTVASNLPQSTRDFQLMGQMVAKIARLNEKNGHIGNDDVEIRVLKDQVKSLAMSYMGQGMWGAYCFEAENDGTLSPFLVRELYKILQVVLGLDTELKDGVCNHVALMSFAVIGTRADIEKVNSSEILPLLHEVWGNEIGISMPSGFIHPGIMGVGGLDALVELKAGLLSDTSEFVENLVVQSRSVAQRASPDAEGMMMGLFPFVISCTSSGDNEATNAQPFSRAYESSQEDQQHFLKLMSDRFPSLMWSSSGAFVYALEEALETFLMIQGGILAGNHGIKVDFEELEVVGVKIVGNLVDFAFECHGQSIGCAQLDIFMLRMASPDWVKEHVDDMMDEEDVLAILG
jgi:hypothetical protein